MLWREDQLRPSSWQHSPPRPLCCGVPRPPHAVGTSAVDLAAAACASVAGISGAAACASGVAACALVRRPLAACGSEVAACVLAAHLLAACVSAAPPSQVHASV